MIEVDRLADAAVGIAAGNALGRLGQLLGALAGCGGGNSSSKKAAVTVILVEENKTEHRYEINVTDGCTLRQALFEAKLIDEENSVGFFVETIDGYSALAEDGVMWVVCDENGQRSGEQFDDTKEKFREWVEQNTAGGDTR